MLSILGFVLNMPELTNILEKPSIARTMATAKFEMPDPLSLLDNDPDTKENSWDEPGRRPARQVPVGTKPDRARGAGLSWARRGSPDSIRDAKRLPKRKSW
jgi:hypothetical protein